MTTYIALLRAINVGGTSLAMAGLRDLLGRLGLAGARSVLQSGNLVFRCAARRTAALERLLETETRRRLGVDTAYVVRTAAQWKSVVARNPFPAAARRDPAHLLVMFLKRTPTGRAVKRLRATIEGREMVGTAGAHAYIVYPDGVGRSRLTTALIERTLETSATGRNWNTVLKIAALATTLR